jgi:hypothetical protein
LAAVFVTPALQTLTKVRSPAIGAFCTMDTWVGQTKSLLLRAAGYSSIVSNITAKKKLYCCNNTTVWEKYFI